MHNYLLFTGKNFHSLFYFFHFSVLIKTGGPHLDPIFQEIQMESCLDQNRIVDPKYLITGPNPKDPDTQPFPLTAGFDEQSCLQSYQQPGDGLV